MKRRPLLNTLRVDAVHGYGVGFDTVAWESVTEYARAREIARHIAAMRPGTTGENRPTGCLRTEADWRTRTRYLSSVGRRVRTADAALLLNFVAAHKEGIVTIPELAALTGRAETRLAEHPRARRVHPRTVGTHVQA